jgi:ribulose-phosphate 3-epimerase
MDQQFVPNLSFGPDIVKNIRKHSKLFFDVHLMVSNPFEMIDSFINAGADGISFHIEASESRFTLPPRILINKIKRANLLCGIAIKPKTPFKIIKKYMDLIDYVVVMAVEPGFAGQKFIPESLNKIQEIHQFIIENNLLNQVSIQIDGGVKLHNAKDVVDAGANILVAGSEVFQSENPTEVINKMSQV